MQTIKLKTKGQILVILLLALSILSIFVVVLASNARRDVIETVQNQQYEQNLSIAEDKLLKIVEGEIDVDSFSGCTTNLGVTTCTFDEAPEDGSLDNIRTTVTVEDEEDMDDLPLEQDRNLKLQLNDFRGELDISWTNDTTWEFSLDYIDLSDNRYYTVKETYDDLALFVNPSNVCFTSLPTPSSNPNNAIRLNLTDPFNANCLANGSANYELVGLRLKPLGNSTNVSVTRASGIGYPAQIRVLTSEAFSNVNDVPNVPKAVVELLEPLHESPIELFDYVYRGETSVIKN